MAGMIGGLGGFIATAISCSHQCPESQTPMLQLPIYVLWWGVLGAVFGSIPCFIVLLATPAKTRPWRSLLTLVPGAAIGFIAVVVLFRLIEGEDNPDFDRFFWASIIVPTLAGFIAAQSLRVKKTAQRL